MHPYLKYLLQDIENAHKSNEEDFSRPEPQTFEQRMEEIERYVKGDYEKPFSYYTALHFEDFPPSEQLSEEEMKNVLEAFDKMMESWNVSLYYPEEMPTKKRYDFLVEHVLETGFTPISEGEIGFDFCTGDAPDCAWGEYCPCLQYWEEEEDI